MSNSLSSIPLFAELTEKELKAVDKLTTEIAVPAGTVLAREGQIGHELVVIVSGTASVTRAGHEIAKVGPGDFQGEVSILDNGPRTATVTAITDMQILVASSQEFNALLDKSPVIARRMLPVLARRLRAISLAHTH